MYPSQKVEVYTNVGLESLNDVAADLLKKAETKKVWCFEGEMGAGKTTLIKQLGDVLGVVDVVHSPTFGIVNEYLRSNGEKVFHFDFYRIRNVMEAVDMGLEDYLYSGSYCFIEWPEKIAALLPDERLTIHITTDDEQHRRIAITVP